MHSHRNALAARAVPRTPLGDSPDLLVRFEGVRERREYEGKGMGGE